MTNERNSIKSIIIEDEPLAASLLEDYSKRYVGLENIGTFFNAQDAIPFLAKHPVDLIFLDLHLL